jgi:hypothetical protein
MSLQEIRIRSSTILKRIYQAETRIIVNEGSSRSTKTYSILQYVITECLNAKIRVTVCRAKLTWLKSTVIPDFKEVMHKQFNEWDEDSWNKSDSIYYFNNGSEISFVGIDEKQKLHGRKQEIAWVNEAVEIEQGEFTQLLLRTTKRLILDYNPAYESHWIYDKVIPRDDCTFIKSTYKDNPFLEPEIVQEIERLEPTPENIKQGTADEVSWKIYGLGERAAQSQALQRTPSGRRLEEDVLRAGLWLHERSHRIDPGRIGAWGPLLQTDHLQTRADEHQEPRQPETGIHSGKA